MRLHEFTTLDTVATPTAQEIALKHGVPLGIITQQLVKGINVEKEHTSDTATAREIALDHLNELPDYYTKLIDMEREH